MPAMNDLDDDSLLDIFSRLNVIDKLGVRGVCRRWMHLSDSYNLFLEQTSLGTVATMSCLEDSHAVREKDTICSLFREKDKTKTNVLFKGKFDLSDVRCLERVLKRCPEIRALVLKFCKSISEELLRLVCSLCPNVEHLDLSVSVLVSGNGILRVMTQEMGHNLIHLNLLGCEGLDEAHLVELLRRCNKLEEFIFGRNGPQVTGRFLSSFSSDVMKRVHVYGADELVNRGVGAITSLASGLGLSTEELKIKGQLSVELIRKVVERFPLLKHLELGDFFTDAWIDATHTAIGSAIAQLTLLRTLSFELPELIQFDGNVLAMMRGCSQLRSLRMRGGPIGDLTIELLVKWCPFLEELALIYSHNFPSQQIRPSGSGLSSLSRLKSLRLLTLNGTHVNDEAFNDIVSSCHELTLMDIRDSPEITNDSLNCVFEAALLRPDQRLKVFIDGTGMEIENPAELELPANLELVCTRREEFVDDIEFEGEEFEVYANNSRYTDQLEPSSGVLLSEMYNYLPPEDGIRYVLEDL